MSGSPSCQILPINIPLLTIALLQSPKMLVSIRVAWDNHAMNHTDCDVGRNMDEKQLCLSSGRRTAATFVNGA